MIPLAIPQMTGREKGYLAECVDTNFVSSVGPFVDRFETMVAEACGARHSVATPSGTTGLHVALTAVGVKPGDLVICPSFTFIASANAIRHCGADPWLFDVTDRNWTLNVQSVSEALRQCRRVDGDLVHPGTGQRIAAVMPVYTMGTPADMEPLSVLAKREGIPVVVDAAAALGASYKGRPIGAAGAQLSVFSFNGNKTVTAGGGGAVCGNDEKLVDLVRHLSTTARVSTDYTHDRVGFNYRMTNLQAAVGCAQMESLDDFVAAKRRIAKAYNEAFAGTAGLQAFPCSDDRLGANWFTGFCVDPAIVGKVTSLVDELRRDGIGARPFWKPVHLQPPFRDAVCEEMRVTDLIGDRILTLPCSTGLSAEDQHKVIRSLRRIVGEKA